MQNSGQICHHIRITVYTRVAWEFVHKKLYNCCTAFDNCAVTLTRHREFMRICAVLVLLFSFTFRCLLLLYDAMLARAYILGLYVKIWVRVMCSLSYYIVLVRFTYSNNDFMFLHAWRTLEDPALSSFHDLRSFAIRLLLTDSDFVSVFVIRCDPINQAIRQSVSRYVTNCKFCPITTDKQLGSWARLVGL